MIKKRVKHRGITFKYMKDHAGHHVYGFLNRRILADDSGHVTHEFTSPKTIGGELAKKKEAWPKSLFDFISPGHKKAIGSLLN